MITTTLEKVDIDGTSMYMQNRFTGYSNGGCRIELQPVRLLYKCRQHGGEVDLWQDLKANSDILERV